MTHKPVMFLYSYPLCSTKKQYNLWKDVAKQYRPNPKNGFCEDCTKEYQKKMIAEQRCENPHVWFCKDEDGFEHGTSKIKEEQ